ncbi:MAG: sugar ABC transporter permease [Chloroflexota bacterium]|nr:sugar ABC transporter permease [Chloroflexota bacterium]
MPKLTLRRRRILWAYAFLLIPLVFFLWIRIYPTLSAFNISLREWNILAEEKPWVGLANYAKIFEELGNSRSVTHKAFVNTFLYVLIGMPAQLIIALGVALMLDRIRRAVGFFRAAYFIPFVTSAVAVAWVWRWLYQPKFGPINVLLKSVGLPDQPFLASPDQALVSIAAVVVWQGLGFAIIIFLAGLQQIPQTLYEAARIDGANGRQEFRYITLPMLNTSIVYLAVLQTISFLRMFAHVINMTRQGSGGPLNSTVTVVLHVYRSGFSSYKMGYASALTVLLFLVILIITVVQLRVLQRRVDY